MADVPLINITLQNLIILLLVAFIIGMMLGVSLGRPRMM